MGRRDSRYTCTMGWGNEPGATLAGRVLETAVGAANGGDERLFVIDFSNGDSIKDVMSDPNAISINVFSSAGEIIDVSGTLVEVSGNYRVYLKLDPADADRAELRVALEINGNPWGET